jgi:hypothetical protein
VSVPVPDPTTLERTVNVATPLLVFCGDEVRRTVWPVPEVFEKLTE